MAILGVDDMKAKLVGGGARPNLFKVTMAFPAYVTANVELASYMCKATSMPASTIAPIAVPFRGRNLQIAGDRTFDPWSVTIINDTDFNVRNSFEQWMNGINQHKLNTGLTQPSSYMADMIVEQLDKDGTVEKTYNIRGTFPTNLGAIELSYDSENAIEEFEVELQIQYWESNKTT
jgi:hypothetical protein|tara:strand:- start:227 stop:754 length:528 start_codon:yes stop_codon:yes gene_type:complete